MPIDPSIALQYQSPQFMSPAQMISLRNIQRQGQLQQLQLAEAQRQQQVRGAIQQRLSQPGAVDPNTGLPTAATAAQITQFDPQLGAQFAKERVQLSALSAQEQEKQIKIGQERYDLGKEVMREGAMAYQEAYDASGGNVEAATRAATEARNAAMDRQWSSGLARGVGIDENQYNASKAKPFNITEAMGMFSPQERATLKKQYQWGEPYQMGGATVQKNKVTGEIRTAVSRPPITNVFGAKGKPPSGYRWGPDDEQGNPTLVPIGGGPADVGKSAEETAQAIANYQLPMLSGWVLKSPWGQKVMGKVTELNPQYDARLYQAGQKVISDFAGGKTGQMVQSFNVVIQHTDVMRKAAEALKNDDIRAFNALTQRFAQETGQAAPTNFDAVKRIWGDEITKAVTGSAGALGDREALERSLSRANSPAQLLGVMDQYEYLMAGQVLGAKKRYESNSGRKDFNKFLLPATLDAMEKHGYKSDEAPSKAVPDDIKSLLDKYGGSR